MALDLPPPELQIALERDGAGVTLRVAGEIDLLTAPRFAAALAGALDAEGEVLVDVREVSFMDSTGLRALLEARNQADGEGHELALAYTQDGPVARLLELANVLAMFRPAR